MVHKRYWCDNLIANSVYWYKDQHAHETCYKYSSVNIVSLCWGTTQLNLYAAMLQ